MKIRGIAGIVLAGFMAISMMTACDNKEARENELAYRRIGINCMGEKNYEGAIEAFSNALSQANGKVGKVEIDICYYKAAAQSAAGDYEGAHETYESLVEYDKDNSDVYYLRGCLYLKEGDVDKAVEDYDKAVKLAGCNFEIYLQIYDDLNKAGEKNVADKYIKEGLDLVPQDADDYTHLGRLYMLRKEYDRALENMQKGLEEGDLQAQLYLAECMELKGESAKATEYYKSYAKDNAQNSEILNKIGENLMKQEKYEEALEYFELGLSAEKITDQQELMKNEIMALEYSGDFAKAKEKIAAYTEKYPDDEEAAREKVFLETR